MMLTDSLFDVHSGNVRNKRVCWVGITEQAAAGPRKERKSIFSTKRRKKEKDGSCHLHYQMDNKTLLMVSAGLQADLRMSRQMPPFSAILEGGTRKRKKKKEKSNEIWLFLFFGGNKGLLVGVLGMVDLGGKGHLRRLKRILGWKSNPEEKHAPL